MKIALFFILPLNLLAQVQVCLDLSNDKYSYNTLQTLSKPSENDLFVTFEKAFVTNCVKDLGNEILVYEDSIVYKFLYEKKERKRLHKQNVDFRDMIGLTFDVDINLQDGKLIAEQKSISPKFDVSNRLDRKKKERQLYVLKPKVGCINEEYSFLVRSHYNLDDLPEVREYLHNLYSGVNKANFLDLNYEKTNLIAIKESMIKIDTSMICFSDFKGDQIKISKREYLFDDLEISLVSKVDYCSITSTFDLEILYYGLSLPIIDPETTIFKYHLIKFYISNKGNSEKDR